MKKTFTISSLFALFLATNMAVLSVQANPAHATDIDLIITEVLYNPDGADDKYEWLELYNPSSEVIFLNKDKFKLSDSTGVCHKINSDLNLEPHKFAIIADDRDTFLNVYDSYSEKASVLDSSFDFKDIDTIKLSFDKCASWQTEFSYSDNWGGKDNGKTIEKIDFNGDNEKGNWQESCEIGGSPGEETASCEEDPDLPEKNYSKNIKISELLPDPSGDEDADEFTELYNADPKEAVELSGWILEDKAGNSYPLPDISIGSGEYLAFYRNNSAFSLNNTGGETVTLKNPKGDSADSVFYSENANRGYSYALSGESFQWTSTLTPGEENVITTPASSEDMGDSDTRENYSSAENVHLGEILPNPKDGSDNEYIEIKNNGSEPVDLYGWKIKDASESKGYQFKEHIPLNPGEYFAIYRSESKIVLNNSKESVYLYDSQGKIVSSVTYDKSLKNSSYNFDEKGWRWSKYLTPGKKNKFDTAPSLKIKKPKNVYKNILAEFSAKAKDKETKKLKYAWDFGDGKKSHLAKTSHKYLATGKYTVTLSVSDASQTVEKKFTVNSKNSPRPNLAIVKLTPNPIGADSDRETIDLKNESKKDISLDGWKIATGTGEKSYNHPVSDGLVMNAGETKTITREMSKFSLNNKAGKVQLTSPDGKIIDEVEYAKEKIAEGKAYSKIDGEWQWIAPDASEDDTASEEPGENSDASDENRNEDEGEILGASADLSTPESPNEKAYSAEDAFIFYSSLGIINPANEIEESYCPAAGSPANLPFLFATLT